MDKNNDMEIILSICNKLEQKGFILQEPDLGHCIEILDGTIQFLINKDYSEDKKLMYDIRDMIKSNFEDLGYEVEILGAWWLEVSFKTISDKIMDCFKEFKNDSTSNNENEYVEEDIGYYNTKSWDPKKKKEDE